MPTAHAQGIAERKTDPWLEEKGRALALLNGCAAPGKDKHELYCQLQATYDELFRLRAEGAAREQEERRARAKAERERARRRVAVRRAWRYRHMHQFDRKNARTWDTIALHFANWATAFEQALTAGDIERARALAAQFRRNGSGEPPASSSSG